MIAEFIGKAGFTEEEIHLATNGDCMWFAIALADVLMDHGISCDFAVCARPTFSDTPRAGWAHVVAVYKNKKYDIRGNVVARKLHREFHTTRIRPVKRDKLLDGVYGGIEHGRANINHWRNRLQGVIT
jgi:hypothetical protein